MGRILRQMVHRRFFAEIGFASLERYARERLDLSPRTARRLSRAGRSSSALPPRWRASFLAIQARVGSCRRTACHHERALHAQGSARGALLRIRGRAPYELVFELGVDRGERFASGDVRL